MTVIPFTKAHGARNDFLLTWEHDLPALDVEQKRHLAIAICDRYTGPGADGWMTIAPEDGAEANGRIRLFNSDGSDSEISGNGTRCAAALLIHAGHAANEVRVRTGAGVKHMRVLGRQANTFDFEMDMGEPVVEDLRATLPLASGPRDATILNVGNPQCAVFVDHFDFDWRAMGREIEWHPRFPHRTNVSFVRVADRNTIEVRFFERGAGETNSSGTGSTGAMAAAVLRGLVDREVLVSTMAGPLRLRWERTICLRGPAELTVRGEYYHHLSSQPE